MRGIGQLAAAVADVRGPEAGHAVENALAFAVPDVGTIALDDDARSAAPQRLVIGEGMEMMQGVEIFEL